MGASIAAPTTVATADADDALLVARTDKGDRAAFDELFRRHVHPAWRVALAVGGSVSAAEEAVADGFTAALRHRRTEQGYGVPFRLLAVRATVEAASAEATSGVAPAPDATRSSAIVTMRTLPARSRAVLWLTAVEGGTPAQVGAALGLEADEVAGVARRAEDAVRHQSGLAPDADLRRELAPVVVPMPAGLATSASAWWTAWRSEADAAGRRRLGAAWTVGPLTERIVGTAAAIVLAGGIAAALLHDGASGTRSPAVALAGNGEQAGGAPGATPATSTAVPPTTTPPAVVTPSVPATRRAANAEPATPAPSAFAPVAPAASGASGPVALAQPTHPTVAAPPTTSAPGAGGMTITFDAAGTPIAVGIGDAGLGAQVGDTVLGTPPAASGSSIVIVTGLLPPITIPLG